MNLLRGLRAAARDYLHGQVTTREAWISVVAVVYAWRSVRLRNKGVRIMERLSENPPTDATGRVRRLHRASLRFARSVELGEQAEKRFKLMPWYDPRLNE